MHHCASGAAHVLGLTECTLGELADLDGLHDSLNCKDRGGVVVRVVVRVRIRDIVWVQVRVRVGIGSRSDFDSAAAQYRAGQFYRSPQRSASSIRFVIGARSGSAHRRSGTWSVPD